MPASARFYWPSHWTSSTEDLIEDADCDDVFATLIGFQSVEHLPPGAFVQILIAIALDSQSTTSDTTLFPVKHASDPFYLSPTLVSAKALAILRAWCQARPESVLGALPGGAEPTWFELTGEMSPEHSQSTASKAPSPTATGGSKRKSSSLSKPASKKAKTKVDDDGDSEEFELTALMAAGARVGADDLTVWDVLGGAAKQRGSAVVFMLDEQDPVGSKGWDLLDICVAGWEAEASNEYQGRLLGFSPQLLRQINKPPSGPRTDVATILDVILAPFVNSNISHQDECPRERMQSISIRLMGCLADLGLARKVDLDRLIDALSMRLNSMTSSCARSFLAAFQGNSKPFKLRFCLYYLRNYSDFVGTVTKAAHAPSPRKLGRGPSQSSKTKVATSPAPSIVLEHHLSTGPMDLRQASSPLQRTFDSVIRYEAVKLALLQEIVALGEHRDAWRDLALQGKVQEALGKARRKVASLLATRSTKDKRPLSDIDQVQEWVIARMKEGHE